MHPEQSKTLLNLKGDEWKVMRNSLSPTFTTGRFCPPISKTTRKKYRI